MDSQYNPIGYTELQVGNIPTFKPFIGYEVIGLALSEYSLDETLEPFAVTNGILGGYEQPIIWCKRKVYDR